MVKVHYTNLTNQECIMKRDSKIVLVIAYAMLITFITAGIVMIPCMKNFGMWFLQSINVVWIILISWFILSFRKFEKNQKEKGS
jgi:hypothetical protein